MTRVLMIADDLTGAADCAAVFAQRGWATRVDLADPDGDGAEIEHWQDTQVLSIDTNTRWVAPENAAACVAQVMRAHARSGLSGGAIVFFKKVDSTLRGNVGAELAAALKAARAGWAGLWVAVFAPAFPAFGRTTVHGRQLVRGKALQDSDEWRREPNSPQSDIAAMLEAAGLRCVQVELETVRADAADLKRWMAGAAGAVDVVICDAESDADLEAIVQAGMELGIRVLWAGSAGLAHSIEAATSIGLSPMRPTVPEVRGPALFVVGSPAPVSQEQACALADAGDVQVFSFAPTELSGSERFGEAGKRAATLRGCIEQGNDLLLRCDAREMCSIEEGQKVAQSLARVVEPCAQHAGALVVTGGETARAILDAWGIRQLCLLGEIEPGLPYSVAQCGGREILILTKAGGFGTRETLFRCREFIRSHSVPETVTTSMHKPIIAITMGDAAGVGPEIIVKSLAQPEVYAQCRPLVIGDAERLRQADRICATHLTIRSIAEKDVQNAECAPGTIDCVDLPLIPRDLPWGRLSTLAGEGAFQYLSVAARLALEGKVAAICTAPLNKEALHAAGHKFPGHTELLAHLTGTPEVSMMLVTPKLRVLHVTTHIGLIDAIAKIEPALVERTIARGHAALARIGIADPRIGVCGINPHAGENGLFGYGEEEQKIVPAIAACRARGWNVEGPLPADTLFYRAQRGDFDLVIAMYHDQGHGPVKVLGLESGVNITIGLPVVRTSVDHGTAFDIAGTGKADERSLMEALRQAVELAPRISP